METKNVQMTIQEARLLYLNASENLKKSLESTFGKEVFQKITDRIKTYEDACKEIGETPINEKELLSLGMTQDEIVYRKLKTITKALNEGWIADVCNSDISRWYPYFAPKGSPSSFAFDDSDYGSSDAYAGSGSRLCFKSEELSKYAGKQFLELWKEFIL